MGRRTPHYMLQKRAQEKRTLFSRMRYGPRVLGERFFSKPVVISALVAGTLLMLIVLGYMFYNVTTTVFPSLLALPV